MSAFRLLKKLKFGHLKATGKLLHLYSIFKTSNTINKHGLHTGMSVFTDKVILLITNTCWSRTLAFTQALVLPFLSHLVRNFMSAFFLLRLLVSFKILVVISLVVKKKKGDRLHFSFHREKWQFHLLWAKASKIIDKRGDKYCLEQNLKNHINTRC